MSSRLPCWASTPRSAIRQDEWLLLAQTGVLAFGLNYGLLFWGEQHISSGLAALLQATIPVFGMLWAHPYLPGERLNARKLAGALLGVAGVGVIFSHQLGAEGSMALWGSAAVVVVLALGAWEATRTERPIPERPGLGQ